MKKRIATKLKRMRKTWNVPNAETRQAIKDIEEGKNLIRAESVKDLFKKLGI